MIGVGLDVGGTKTLGVALDEDGTLLAERRRATVRGGEELLDELADLYSELVAAAGSPPAPPLGLGLPGLVDRSGVLRFAPNLREADGARVASGLESRLSADGPVVEADNDATCLVAGESSFGAARGERDVLVVTLGTGIGGGVVAGGEVQKGAANFAGEIGHVVVDPYGPPCGCGRRGCWERYASGWGLGRIARDLARAGRAAGLVALAGGDPESVRGEHVFTALPAGDEAAAAVLDEFAGWVALGLSNLVNIFDPRLIVIGGGLVAAGETLLGPVREKLLPEVIGARVRTPVELVPAVLGERGGAIGAAVLGLQAAGLKLVGGS